MNIDNQQPRRSSLWHAFLRVCDRRVWKGRARTPYANASQTRRKCFSLWHAFQRVCDRRVPKGRARTHHTNASQIKSKYFTLILAKSETNSGAEHGHDKWMLSQVESGSVWFTWTAYHETFSTPWLVVKLRIAPTPGIIKVYVYILYKLSTKYRYLMNTTLWSVALRNQLGHYYHNHINLRLWKSH